MENNERQIIFSLEEKDELSKIRLQKIEDELYGLKGEEAKLKDAWEKEKGLNDNIKSKKKEK